MQSCTVTARELRRSWQGATTGRALPGMLPTIQWYAIGNLCLSKGFFKLFFKENKANEHFNVSYTKAFFQLTN